MLMMILILPLSVLHLLVGNRRKDFVSSRLNKGRLQKRIQKNNANPSAHNHENKEERKSLLTEGEKIIKWWQISIVLMVLVEISGILPHIYGGFP